MKHLLALCLFALSAFAQTHYLIEGDRRTARATLGDAPVTVHSDLRPDHLLAHLNERQISALRAAGLRVADAPTVLIEGRKTIACWHHGPLAQTAGDGWDGPGKGSASLLVYFGPISWGIHQPPMTDARFRELFMEAAGKWSAVVAVDFTPGGTVDSLLTIDVLVGDDLHGDGFGFNQALAHALPPMWYVEPKAGGTHFNNHYQWVDYSNGNPWTQGWDIRHVMVHELGHSAMGLNHLGGDSVMGAYYNGRLQLSSVDVWWAQQNFLARAGGSPPDGGGGTRDERGGTTPAGLAMTATAPSSTTASTVSITGTITGGTPPYTLTWTGSTATASGFPITVNLVPGANTITISAADSAGATANVTLTINRVAEDGRSGRGN